MSTDTANSEYKTLTRGPSREELFDCLKYSPISSIHPAHCVVDFWVESCLQRVEIEGLHRADTKNARSWFFWGRIRRQGSGPTWKSIEKAEKGQFVFGRWDTFLRKGKIKYCDKSFFENPL